MKRRFIYVMAGCLALSLSACGGGSEAGNEETGKKAGKKEATEQQTKTEINVTPKTVEVSGDMFGCFKVVDRTYKAIGDEWGSIITVEVERTDVSLPFDLSRDILTFSRGGDGDYVNVGFGIEFYDKDGNSISKTTPNTTRGSYDAEEAVMIVKLRSGDTGSIRFNAVDGAASFKLTSAYRDSHSNVNTPAKEESSDEGELNVSYDYSNAKDMYGKAVDDAKDMYNDAVDKAKDMYNDALDDAKGMYGGAMDDAIDEYKNALDEFDSYGW